MGMKLDLRIGEVLKVGDCRITVLKKDGQQIVRLDVQAEPSIPIEKVKEFEPAAGQASAGLSESVLQKILAGAVKS